MPNKHAFVSQGNSYIITLFPSHIQRRWLNVPALYRHLFPNNKAPIMLDTDNRTYQTTIWVYKTRKHYFEGGDLTGWFKAHQELKAGDKIRISVIKPMEKYSLEIVNN